MSKTFEEKFEGFLNLLVRGNGWWDRNDPEIAEIKEALRKSDFNNTPVRTRAGKGRA